MRNHGLSEAELVMTDARADEPSSRPNWRWDLAGTIAAVTNTAIIWDRGTFLFIGREPGPVIAAYLQDLCVRAVDREAAAFRNSDFYRRRRKAATKRAATADFTDAMVRRLRHRLNALFGDLQDAAARAAAARSLHARFPDTYTPNRSERDTRYAEAAALGHVAGGRARLDRGISSGAAAQLSHHGDRT